MPDPQTRMEALLEEYVELQTRLTSWNQNIDGFLALGRWSRSGLAEAYELEMARQKRFSEDRRPLSRARFLRVLVGGENNPELLHNMITFAVQNPQPGSLLATNPQTQEA